MLRFLTGFFIGFIAIFSYFSSKSRKSDKIIKNKSLLSEDTTKLINVLKEFQKMKERI